MNSDDVRFVLYIAHTFYGKLIVLTNWNNCPRAGSYVAPLRHMILIPSLHVFVLTPYNDV